MINSEKVTVLSAFSFLRQSSCLLSGIFIKATRAAQESADRIVVPIEQSSAAARTSHIDALHASSVPQLSLSGSETTDRPTAPCKAVCGLQGRLPRQRHDNYQTLPNVRLILPIQPIR